MMRNALFTVLTCMMAALLAVGNFGLPPDRIAYAAETKIVLTPSMVTNESGLGDATLLVDEQALAGDPANGTGGAPVTSWQAGWNASLYPAQAYIDLGQLYDLTSIYLRDTYDMYPITISAGSPGNWTELFTDPLTGWMTWDAHPVDVKTRYVRVMLHDPRVNMSEIVLYGTPADGGGGGDTIAPAAVTDLAATSSTASTVSLTWTAPGDDGMTGTASSYDIRYSMSDIKAADWASATPAVGAPAPALAGTAQSMTVTGLSPATTYYFALRAKDGAGNEADLSNVASVTTATTNDTIPPAAIKTLKAVSWTSDSVTLAWTAPGDDGMTGQASSYEIRYGDKTIVDGKTSQPDVWSESAVFNQTAVPKPAGGAETMTVTGLLPGTFYSFAIKTKDKAGNTSALSNSIAVRTDPNPADMESGMLTEWYDDTSLSSFQGRVIYDRFDWKSWLQPNEVKQFGLRATARVKPAYSQTYTFYTKGSSTTGVRLWVGGQLLVDTWNNPTATEQSAALALTANQFYDVRLEMKGTDRASFLQVYWSSPGQAKELLKTPKLTALPDSIPPNAITDLTAAPSGKSSVQLAFTAPGDDDIVLPGLSTAWGRVATYEVRYSTAESITADNWDQATKATVYPVSKKAGDAELIAVNGLRAGTTYYFAVKGVDEAGNASAVSNPVSAMTAGTADTIAPGTVSNLTASNPTLTTVQLNWTAPGNDGSTGKAASYEVRFGQSSINATNWDAATRVIGAPEPAAAGTAQSMTVQGLRPGTTYSFALRTSDEAGNVSAISAPASITTPVAPGGYIIAGASSMDLIVKPAEAGKVYYAVYNAAQTPPTAAALKAAAQGANGGALVKNGVMPVDQAGAETVRTIGKLADNATYYTYWVAEGQSSGLGTVYSSTNTLAARQRLVQFTSPLAGVGTVQYLLYMPEEAYRNPNGAYPMLLFMPGGTEEGTDAGKLTTNGPAKRIKNGDEMPFIVVTAQSKGTPNTRWYTPGYADQFVNHAMGRFPGDPNRLYVTGLSNGGGGAYYYATEHPERVAALLPVAPQLKNHDATGYPSFMTKELAARLNGIPQWTFTNSNDGTIMRNWVEKPIRFLVDSPNPPVLSPMLTVYQENAHSGWEETYANPDIYTWMLQQSK
ncbi:fibronectin type III domain-containing protein [Paenibacillus sp. GCM10027626]|uniref:fibronectin type III domain-containing protein n=1 Tax=Paenibacillus sp. GCM10027626 TaxID=3273411 RepID=UPI003639A7D6